MGKQEKIERLRSALSHEEGDRVPISDFFWTGFLKSAREKWGKDFDPYRFFDLDYVVINPNMDPHIKDFEILEEKGEDILLRTGFEAVVRRSGDKPMPHFERFSIAEPEDMEAFAFDPVDTVRLNRSGDDQINCLGDTLARNIPSWNDRVNAYVDDFAVFGSICEPYEYLWRVIGTENALVWMALEPKKLKKFIDRIGEFLLELARLQIKESRGRLSGMYVWGDIAYVNGMMFSPALWRELVKPHTARIVKECRDAGLMVVYHGCGDARAVYGDFLEMGLPAYNPLEVKAHLDVVELKRQYAGKLAFVGNIDVRVLETGDERLIKRELLYKLQAAQGGGWVCQSDHSVSSSVAPESYALLVKLLREYGRYPLDMARIQREQKELEDLKGVL